MICHPVYQVALSVFLTAVGSLSGWLCGWLFGGDAMRLKMQSSIRAAEATSTELRKMALNLSSVIDDMKRKEAIRELV